MLQLCIHRLVNEVARVLPSLRSIWEDDEDFPCRLKPYQRVHGWMKAQRRKGGPK